MVLKSIQVESHRRVQSIISFQESAVERDYERNYERTSTSHQGVNHGVKWPVGYAEAETAINLQAQSVQLTNMAI